MIEKEIIEFTRIYKGDIPLKMAKLLGFTTIDTDMVEVTSNRVNFYKQGEDEDQFLFDFYLSTLDIGSSQGKGIGYVFDKNLSLGNRLMTNDDFKIYRLMYEYYDKDDEFKKDTEVFESRTEIMALPDVMKPLCENEVCSIVDTVKDEEDEALEKIIAFRHGYEDDLREEISDVISEKILDHIDFIHNFLERNKYQDVSNAEKLTFNPMYEALLLIYRKLNIYGRDSFLFIALEAFAQEIVSILFTVLDGQHMFSRDRSFDSLVLLEDAEDNRIFLDDLSDFWSSKVKETSLDQKDRLFASKKDQAKVLVQ